jgi:hypothetical protein
MADATPQSLDSLFYKTADPFFADHTHTALTYDDVTLATLYSEVLPRDAQLDTRLTDSLNLRIPIVSADMDTVTEAEMAIALARCGGLGLIHCNMPERVQLSEVSRVKNNVHGLISDPIKPKTVLHISDGLIVKFAGGREFDASYATTPGILLASTDPVALDAMALDRFEKLCANPGTGIPPIPKIGNVPHIAGAVLVGAGNSDPTKIEIINAK